MVGIKVEKMSEKPPQQLYVLQNQVLEQSVCWLLANRVEALNPLPGLLRYSREAEVGAESKTILLIPLPLLQGEPTTGADKVRW